MNMHSLHRIIFVSIAVVFTGCSTLSPHKSQSVVGTRVNPAGTIWTLSVDGTFAVRVKMKNHTMVTFGKYTVSGDTITIQNTDPKTPKDCRPPAIYHFHRAGDRLEFTLVKDSCGLRAQQVPLGWHLQKM
jgi:hypothetical protein